MGSYITIAFACRWQNKHIFIQKCKELFSDSAAYITGLSCKYPADESYSVWNSINESIAQIETLLDICFDRNLAEIRMDYIYKDRSIPGIVVKIEKILGDSIGIHFALPEIFLLDGFSIDCVEKEIVSVLKEKVRPFDYAFCDHETDIECDLIDVLEGNAKYSILVCNTTDSVVVRFANWKIDGLTSRHFC